MKLLNRLMNATEKLNKHRLFNYLSGLPNYQLEAYGFSPSLLEQGLKAWPWREDDQTDEISKVETMIIEEQRCVAELESYSDSELQDLGLSRGSIRISVRQGRPGIDDVARDKAA